MALIYSKRRETRGDKQLYANDTNQHELASQARHNMDAQTELFASRNVVFLTADPPSLHYGAKSGRRRTQMQSRTMTGAESSGENLFF
jgi:hypothetical protein